MPTYQPMPGKKPDETNEEYERRCDEFLKELKRKAASSGMPYSPVMFRVPPQDKEFAAYCKANKNAQWEITGGAQDLESVRNTIKGLSLNVKGLHINCEDASRGHEVLKSLHFDDKDSNMNLLSCVKSVNFKDRREESWVGGTLNSAIKKINPLHVPNPADALNRKGY